MTAPETLALLTWLAIPTAWALTEATYKVGAWLAGEDAA